MDVIVDIIEKLREMAILASQLAKAACARAKSESSEIACLNKLSATSLSGLRPVLRTLLWPTFPATHTAETPRIFCSGYRIHHF